MTNYGPLHVQIDVNETAVWSGVLPALPAVGNTIEVRGSGEYRVTGVHWIVFADEPYYASVLVDAEEWTP